MSHFIATSISISKDLKTFKVKGGDNNLYPRSNNWTNDVNLNHLFDEINGGGLKLQSHTEKSAYINFLVNKYKSRFGGNFKDKNDYWHLKRFDKQNQKVLDFDIKFLTELKEGLKNLCTKENYILMYNDSYIKKVTKNYLHFCSFEKNAKHYSKYRAILIVDNSSRKLKIKTI